MTLEERFWSKVNIIGHNDCWEWTSALRDHGYGAFNIGNRAKKAHRVAWELSNGPIPGGLGVLHRCDNPPCCNPAHLFLGTQKDNLADCSAKGRVVTPDLRGEKHHQAKLTAGEVITARRLHSTGLYTGRSLARMFEIGFSQMYRVLNRTGWRHLND